MSTIPAILPHSMVYPPPSIKLADTGSWASSCELVMFALLTSGSQKVLRVLRSDGSWQSRAAPHGSAGTEKEVPSVYVCFHSSAMALTPSSGRRRRNLWDTAWDAPTSPPQESKELLESSRAECQHSQTHWCHPHFGASRIVLNSVIGLHKIMPGCGEQGSILSIVFILLMGWIFHKQIS